MDAFAGMKSLQNLCILGQSGRINYDSKRTELIDENLWNAKKYLFIPRFRKFDFIRNVDIFLPIMNDILIKAKDTMIEEVRLHGLTEEEAAGQKPVYCACKHMPEKMEIRQTPP